MSRAFVVGAMLFAFIAVTVASGATARASWEGSITTPINSARITNPDTGTPSCHGVPIYFQTQYGWSRACSGGYDMGNGGSSNYVYIRGYFWNSIGNQAKMVNKNGPEDRYYNTNCTNKAGDEYGIAFEVYPQNVQGKFGAAFHHLSNYHYTVGTFVDNGTYVADQANWGAAVYFCGGGLASSGAHIHMEAGSTESINNSWGWTFNSPYYYDPYVHFQDY